MKIMVLKIMPPIKITAADNDNDQSVKEQTDRSRSTHTHTRRNEKKSDHGKPGWESSLAGLHAT